MRLIIHIPEEDYKRGTLGLYFNCYSAKLHDIVLNGTPIPDNATNGDVIKAMFPEGEYRANQPIAKFAIDGWCYEFVYDWWNAPYQKGGTDETL